MASGHSGHSGHSGAFALAYRENVEFVWRTLARRGVERSALEDATQEVFMITLQRWGAWEGQASIRAWLFGVARRVAATHHRSHGRRQRKHDSLSSLAGLDDADPSFDDRLDDRARLSSIAEAIDALPAKQREVFMLADVEAMSAPAIAELLGENLNTIYTRLRRARASVSAALTESSKQRTP